VAGPDPQQLLTDLFSSPERIAAAASQLSPQEQRLLLRAAGRGWARSDVPLLDEAMELLGEDERQGGALGARVITGTSAPAGRCSKR